MAGCNPCTLGDASYRNSIAAGQRGLVVTANGDLGAEFARIGLFETFRRFGP